MKGEEDILKLISGIFGSILILMIAISAFNSLNEAQCQPYKDTIAKRDIDISGLNQTIVETNNLLDQCRNEYNRLITENISKRDIEEIKGYYNLTQIQIGSLEQKFETVSNNYNTIYMVILNQYQISFVINLFFVLDLFSIAVFKNEIIFFALRKVKKRIKKPKNVHAKKGG